MRVTVMNKPNIMGVAVGACEVVDGIARILSLGTLHLNLSFRVTVWFSIRQLKRRKANRA